VSCGYAMRRMENAQIARIRAGMGPTWWKRAGGSSGRAHMAHAACP
jgi:hypothetical protein